MSLKKTIKQEDLRKLMKQKTVSEKKKIDSPLAKYNNLGQLVCTVCQTIIKSETLWNAHLLSRSHKETVLKNNVRRPAASNVQILPPPEKRIKLKEIPKPKSILKNPLPQTSKPTITDQQMATDSRMTVTDDYTSFSSSDDEEADSNMTEDNKSLDEEGLDKDAILVGISKTLPEGFFDNPILDAKARNVPYKNKMEEEMELFHKEIKEQSMVSETIVGEEDDQREDEKIIEEIDEQMSRWSRIQQLAKQKEPLVFTKNSQYLTSVDDSNSEEDSSEMDDVWRTKSSFRTKKI